MQTSKTNNIGAYVGIGLFSLVAFSFLVWLIYIKPEPQGPIPPIFAHLPLLNCIFNGFSALSLCIGLWFIKHKNKHAHMVSMLTAFMFSTLFLVSYVIYHSVHGDSIFLGQGWIRPVYFFILISHILLTIAGLPLILSTFFLALIENFERHKKVARWTFPIWLYISVTGVLIYGFLKFF
jgi:putative membrane protein